MIDIGSISRSRAIATHLCHGVMRVQAFLVLDADVESRDASVGVEHAPDAARRILAKHRVLAVDQRESLFVLAFGSRLHRGPKRSFDPIKQGDQVQWRTAEETYPQARDTALGVRCRDHAAFAAQPRQHGGMTQRFPCTEIGRELCLNKLT